MWHENKSVNQVYTNIVTKYTWAIIEGLSDWKRLKPVSSDGVTNVQVLLSKAKAKNRKVDVLITENEIKAVVLK